MVLRAVERAKVARSDTNKRLVTDLVGGELPEHGSSKTFSVDVLGLGLDNVGGVIRDELALGRVVRVRGHIGGVLEDFSARKGQGVVGVDTSLNGARTLERSQSDG